jgi:hypothetical protein
VSLYDAIRWACLKFARWYFIGRPVVVVSVFYPGTLQDKRKIVDVSAEGPTLMAHVGYGIRDAYGNLHIESVKTPIHTLTYDALWRSYVWTK